jgi:hypothetical protein
MIRTTIRLLTATVVIVMSGIAVAQGWDIVRFFLASVNIVSSEKRAVFADALRARSGIISTALLNDLDDETNRSDVIAAYRQRELLAAILSIKPMSSMHWLSLSRMELMTHQSMDDVFGSLELSMLTGPNEGHVMEDRRFFGVSLWDRLPPDLKRRVTNDVAGEIRDSFKFRVFASAQPEQVKNELREALGAAGLSPKEIETRLGN